LAIRKTGRKRKNKVLIAVALQALVTLLAGLFSWLVWGPLVALSLVAGGGSIVVPNALLAMRVKASRPPYAPAVLLVGEFVKIGLSVLLLWLSYRWIEGLSWPGLIFGLVLALQSLLLAPWANAQVDKWRAAKAV
jgi:ATP synthase protein I